jgi:hypothetical protein
VSRYESADAAETSLRAHRNEDNETEFESHEIGSAGYVQRTPFYDLSFRDANVRGSVSHVVDGGGDEEFVFDTAVTMHERWR